MHPLDNPAYDDQLLAQYLLGALPAEQTERMDELSIANDEFAWRLAQIENNLVDDFVRGNLDGATLKQFNSFYLQSARRRQKVEFAEGFRWLQRKLALSSAVAKTSGQAGFSQSWFSQSWLSKLFAPRKVLPFALASALLSALFICTFLVVDDVHLRSQVDNAHAQQASLDQHAQQLEKEIAGLRAGNAGSPAGNTSGVAPDLKQIKIISALLPPPLRGIGPIKTVLVPAGVDLVVLQLTLESAGFSDYRVKLKEAGSEQVIWQNAEIAPGTLGGQKVLSAGIPANLLKTQNYVAEVSGIAHSSKAEIIGDYAFHLVIK